MGEDDGSVEVCVMIENQLVSDVTMSLQTDTANSGEGCDYVEMMTSLIFVASSTRECSSIVVINDRLYENDETFYVRLFATDTRVQINPNKSQVTVQINDDDGRLVVLKMQLPCKYTYFLQLSESWGESAYKRGCTGTGKPQNFNLP